MAITNMTITPNTSFTLRSTEDAKLPVLINAFEVYTVSDLLSLGTDSRDLKGLAILQLQFEVLIQWSGDPCLPSKDTQWEWVECSTSIFPRIVSLNLSSFGLVGALPDFSSIDALVTIDLHDNGLEGPIPEFLGSLPFLKLLDLSNNRFNGTIPASLSGNKDLKLVGMSCPPPPPPPSPPPPKVTTPPADTAPDSPPADSPVPLVPSTTPFSQVSRPPRPDEFHIYSTSTSTSNKATQLILLIIALLQTIILAALC